MVIHVLEFNTGNYFLHVHPISGKRDQSLGGHHGKCGARACNGGLGRGQSPKQDLGAEALVRVSGGSRHPEDDSILVIVCPTKPANLAPLVKFSKYSCNVHLISNTGQ